MELLYLSIRGICIDYLYTAPNLIQLSENANRIVLKFGNNPKNGAAYHDTIDVLYPQASYSKLGDAHSSTRLKGESDSDYSERVSKS